MKKFELIKYAYDNYPKGTIVHSTSENGTQRTLTGIYHINEYGSVEDSGWLVYNSSQRKWAEIVKPKIAVQVENEKEFKALMNYYDSLSWKWNGGKTPLERTTLPQYPNLIMNEDSFMHSLTKETIKNEDYKIIPFSEFAEQHGIKLPHITTHDGVDLYIGDYLACVWKHEGEWKLTQEYPSIHNNTVSKAGQSALEGERKLFSTKQAALDWIEAHKPKLPQYVKLNKDQPFKNKVFFDHLEISGDFIKLINTGEVIWMFKPELEAILYAMNNSVKQK